MFMMFQQSYSFSGYNPFMTSCCNPFMTSPYMMCGCNPFMMGGYNPRMNFLFEIAAATSALQQMQYQPAMPSINPCSIFNPYTTMNYATTETICDTNKFKYIPPTTSSINTPSYFPSILTSTTRSLEHSSQQTRTKSPDTSSQQERGRKETLKYSNNILSEIRNSNIMKNVPETRKNQILSAVDEACKKYNMDPKLVISMIYRESGFDPNATSQCGAAGLMQLMPATARAYGAKDVYNIRENIFAGVKYLSYLKQRYNGNRDLMIAAYNAGPGRVHNTVPNIKETKNYVARVNNTYSSLA